MAKLPVLLILTCLLASSLAANITVSKLLTAVASATGVPVNTSNTVNTTSKINLSNVTLITNKAKAPNSTVVANTTGVKVPLTTAQMIALIIQQAEAQAASIVASASANPNQAVKAALKNVSKVKI